MIRSPTAMLILAWLATAPSLAFAEPAHAHDLAHGAAVTGPPQEAGQSAFAAISEIVDRLTADPNTDWSKVNVDALRSHLTDMDNVLLRARVTTSPVPRGAVFDVTGETPAIQDAIRRMALAHATMVNGVDGQRVVATATAQGARVEVIGAEATAIRIRALGFFGLLVEGGHHGPHHWMMATGAMTH